MELGLCVSACGSWSYSSIHVALDLSGAQRPVVNPDLVYSPSKILAVNGIPTYLQSIRRGCDRPSLRPTRHLHPVHIRSEEHTSELQSQSNLVCRLLLEKKKTTTT